MKLCASNQVRRIGESDASSTIVEYASISLEQNLLGLSSLLERFQAILAYYPAPSISQSRKILQWVLSRLVCGRPHIFQIPNRHRHFPRGSIDSMNTKSYVHMWPFTGLSVIMRKESESGLINSLWHTTYSIFGYPDFLPAFVVHLCSNYPVISGISPTSIPFQIPPNCSLHCTSHLQNWLCSTEQTYLVQLWIDGRNGRRNGERFGISSPMPLSRGEKD